MLIFFTFMPLGLLFGGRGGVLLCGDGRQAGKPSEKSDGR